MSIHSNLVWKYTHRGMWQYCGWKTEMSPPFWITLPQISLGNFHAPQHQCDHSYTEAVLFHPLNLFLAEAAKTNCLSTNKNHLSLFAP